MCEGGLCVTLIFSHIFNGNLVCLECRFISISVLLLLLFSWEAQRKLWSHRGESADVCKYSCGCWEQGGLSLQTLWCWMFIRSGLFFLFFLRNHDHWAGLLDLFGARPLACHYKPKLALRLHPFPLSLSWVTQWANYKSVGAVCVLQPLKNTTAFFYRVFNRNVCIHQEEFNWTWFCSDFLKKNLI